WSEFSEPATGKPLRQTCCEGHRSVASRSWVAGRYFAELVKTSQADATVPARRFCSQRLVGLVGTGPIMISATIRVVALAVIGIVTNACSGNSVSGPSEIDATFLSFTSSPGDYIGQGETHRYTLGDGTWQARVDVGVTEPQHVMVYLTPTTTPWSRWWHLDFSAGTGQPLKVGTYENARRHPFSGAQPGLDFSGTGRGCNTLTGRFVVTALVVGPGNTLDRFHATFEQHCEGRSPALTGESNIVAHPRR